MDTTIIRTYPNKRDDKTYKNRYCSADFTNYKLMLNAPQNYELWKSGINYKTNRKIKIGSKIHNQLRNEFYVYNSNLLLTVLDGIDSELYIQETDKLIKEIFDYNAQIDIIINKINLLEKWEDYIEFDGIKYGIPYIYDNIHRENDCFGIIKEECYYKTCSCSTCENWSGCGKNMKPYYKYKCLKCNS